MIWLATLFIFVSAYNEFSFFSLFPFITDRFQSNKEESVIYLLLLLNCIYNIGRICGFAIWKYCAIRISKVSLVNSCFFLSALIYIFYGFSNSIAWLASARFLTGLICPNYEIMKKYFKEQNRTINTNVYTVMVCLVEKAGAIGGILIGSYLYFYRFPNTDDYPLLTLGIVSAIMLFSIFIIHFMYTNNCVRFRCTINCCNDRDNGMIRIYSDSDEDISIGNEHNQEHNDNENTAAFIGSVVWFSSVYNAYRYLMILYLYWNKYDIISIGRIVAMTEGIGLLFSFGAAQFSHVFVNYEKWIFPPAYLIISGLMSFFPFIIKLTPHLSLLQIGIIVLINGTIDMLYGFVLTLNNGILKKYRLHNTRWYIYSWSTIFTNITSIVFITLITILLRYTKDNEYKLTPFYTVSSLLTCLALCFFC